MYHGTDPQTTTEDGEYIHAYPKVQYPSEDDDNELTNTGKVIIEEKLDGGNFRVRIGLNNLIYGSKKTILGSTPENMNGFFQRPAKYINDTVTNTVREKVIKEYGVVTVFGENMLRHSLDYDFESIPPFIVFDVWSHSEEKFLGLTDAQKVADLLGFEFVPIIDTVDSQSFSQYLGDESESYPLPDSQFRDGKAEGVVMKNYSSQSFNKLVHPDFNEINNLRWSKPQKHSKDYTERIAAEYGTNTRIEKILRKLVMEGHPLDMTITKTLMDEVYMDIWDEHYQEIVTSGKTINTAKLRQRIDDRVRARLKAIIENKKLMEDLAGNLGEGEYLELMAIGSNYENANSE